MRVLTVHNKYRIRGGEDEARESEDCLLTAHGHEVEQIVFDNKNIRHWGSLGVGIQASWCQSSYRRIRQRILAWHPDVVDIHNFFPLASPAVHYAARNLGVPVVQTLHNYRLLCPGATFFRDGKVCEDCTRHLVPWPSMVHGCYRQSRLQTGAVALMVTAHRVLQTWQSTVSLFIAVSEFQRRKFAANGFPETKIAVKPNFVFDPGSPSIGGNDFLFVGRLSAEKGIKTMLTAMDLVGPSLQLRIVGDGPMAAEVSAAAARNPRIQYLGRLPHKDVLQLMTSSRCLIFPSEWYETFGRVAAESFARGTPVIAAGLGAVAEIVDDGRTGLHFRPGDPQDLARVIEQAARDPNTAVRMRKEARNEYEQKYTAERNYEMLLDIYERAKRAA